ncbi:DUF3606 domain-containing protein [Nannocystis sp. ILAH1]|uniref:DUF3606 domain-containing protein n=1 Tax=unclassified Nannocystis TaxID=2627009 RepID=UPI00226D942A|nr:MULTISPECIES: DUF3606 domain-containing protein [unclassified Nannocystis]MCY0992176.1 DUF3606 domain-containing protein [Nannocystis sp. ILAH1]MCY1064396.1 DUF3606 domain-containing protein [Nannocystis sp. RBIL2]
MSDNPKITGPQDAKFINLNQEHEVRTWTKSLNTTPEKLREAVEAVGTSVERVKEHLASHR